MKKHYTNRGREILIASEYQEMIEAGTFAEYIDNNQDYIRENLGTIATINRAEISCLMEFERDEEGVCIVLNYMTSDLELVMCKIHCKDFEEAYEEMVWSFETEIYRVVWSYFNRRKNIEIATEESISKLTILSKEGELYDVFAYTGKMLDEDGDEDYLITFVKHTDNELPSRMSGRKYCYSTLFKKPEGVRGLCIFSSKFEGSVSFNQEQMQQIKDYVHKLVRFNEYTEKAFEILNQ